MKKKNGAFPIRTIAIVTISSWLLILFLGLVNFIKMFDDSWNQKLVEDVLTISLPADAYDIEFDGSTGISGRPRKLDLIFKASTESLDVFVSQFCEGTLYQGYDPFNAIDTSIYEKEKPQGAYIIKMVQGGWDGNPFEVKYYSHSPNTPDTLYGIQCTTLLGPAQNAGRSEIQILVDKTLPDVALVRIEVLFNCYRCIAPSPEPEDPTPTKTKVKS